MCSGQSIVKADRIWQEGGITTMPNCNHDCGNCGQSCGERTPESLMFAPNYAIKNVIGVVSGKGGVGKSLVTGLLACSMNAKGHKTAILDADITGPSIPKMFGIKDGVLSDLRKKEYYQSPSVKRRKKSEAARKNKNKRYY